MAQYARADSLVTLGSWATSPLWSYIDEVTPNENQLISTASGAETECEVGLSNVTDPTTGSGHVMRWRVRRRDDTVTGRFKLYQGTTLIHSSEYTSLTTSWVTHAYTLSAAEANSITDYTDLRFRFESDTVADNARLQVCWAELEVPDAGGGGDLVETVNETVQVSESVVVALTHVPQNYLELVDETVEVSESAHYVRAFPKQVDDTVQISETVVKVLGTGEQYIRRRYDEVQINESVVVVLANDLVDVVNETEQITESVVVVLTQAGAKVVDDTVQVTETVQAVLNAVDELRTVDHTFSGTTSGQVLVDLNKPATGVLPTTRQTHAIDSNGRVCFLIEANAELDPTDTHYIITVELWTPTWARYQVRGKVPTGIGPLTLGELVPV